jgi:hypothetical protein
MSRTNLCLLLASVTLLASTGCQAPTRQPPASPPTASGRPDVASQPEAAPPPMPAHAKKKGPILVGGCKEACEAPKDAFRNFVRALFAIAPEEMPGFRTYIDSTTLVDNGQRLGEKWADMWLMKRFDMRQEEVDRWQTEFQIRVGKVANAQAVEDALETGVQFRRIASNDVEFTFIAPPREGARNSGQWRVRMGKRGLEWLVQEIYD